MKSILRIPWDAEAIMRSRPNRFLALADIRTADRVLKGQKVHVRDPGRLRELLFPGAELLVASRPGGGRKTAWELIAARDREWVLVNSGFHRQISETVLLDPEVSPFGTPERLQAEVRIGHSRIDFLLELPGGEMALEVKGCTLEEGGIALFPDAPTERGARHLRALTDRALAGGDAGIMFLVFRRGAECLMPNGDTDPAFAREFRRAVDAGVKASALKLAYEPSTHTVNYHGEIPVCSD